MKTAALYIRVSTEEQAIKGYSLEAQKEALVKYARENDYEIADIYADEGKSARKRYTSRPAFMKMLGDIKADKINVVLFIKLDRWFRSIKDFYLVQDVLDAHKVDWIATEEQYDTTTSNGRLYTNIRLALAQDEADRTSDRIKFVFESKLAKKEVITGKFPIGFKIENKHLVPNPETAPIARDIFRHYDENGSKHGTSQYVYNTYGITIDRHMIASMLKNPLYKGEYRGIKDYCEPIIDPEEFDRIAAQPTARNNQTRRIYIFSGLVVCGCCGHHCNGRYGTGSSGREVIYYRCNRYTEFKDCNNSKLVNEEKLEKWLLENIEDRARSVIGEYEVRMEQKPKQTVDRAAIRRKLARLKDLYVNEMIDLETYKADYDRYTEQLRDAEIKSKNASPDALAANIKAMKDFLASDFRSMYVELGREQKRAFWRNTLREIRFSPPFNITFSFVWELY